jgi:hypothetical protein
MKLTVPFKTASIEEISPSARARAAVSISAAPPPTQAD